MPYVRARRSITPAMAGDLAPGESALPGGSATTAQAPSALPLAVAQSRPAPGAQVVRHLDPMPAVQPQRAGEMEASLSSGAFVKQGTTMAPGETSASTTVSHPTIAHADPVQTGPVQTRPAQAGPMQAGIVQTDRSQPRGDTLVLPAGASRGRVARMLASIPGEQPAAAPTSQSSFQPAGQQPERTGQTSASPITGGPTPGLPAGGETAARTEAPAGVQLTQAQNQRIQTVRIDPGISQPATSAAAGTQDAGSPLWGPPIVQRRPGIRGSQAETNETQVGVFSPAAIQTGVAQTAAVQTAAVQTAAVQRVGFSSVTQGGTRSGAAEMSRGPASVGVRRSPGHGSADPVSLPIVHAARHTPAAVQPMPAAPLAVPPAPAGPIVGSPISELPLVLAAATGTAGAARGEVAAHSTGDGMVQRQAAAGSTGGAEPGTAAAMTGFTTPAPTDGQTQGIPANMTVRRMARPARQITAEDPAEGTPPVVRRAAAPANGRLTRARIGGGINPSAFGSMATSSLSATPANNGAGHAGETQLQLRFANENAATPPTPPLMLAEQGTSTSRWATSGGVAAPRVSGVQMPLQRAPQSGSAAAPGADTQSTPAASSAASAPAPATAQAPEVDVQRVADAVYSILRDRLIVERESRGLGPI